MSTRRSLVLLRGSFDSAQRALNDACSKYCVTSLASKSVSAPASVHPRSRMRHGAVGPFAFPKKVAKAPRRNSLTPCLSDSRCRTNNGNCLQVRCSSHFGSDVHAASRSGDTRSPEYFLFCCPGRPCVILWCKGATRLQIRALRAIGIDSKPPASQAFKPAPYCPPVHVLTVCSAPVNRMQSGSINGSTTSIDIMVE